MWEESASTPTLREGAFVQSVPSILGSRQTAVKKLFKTAAQLAGILAQAQTRRVQTHCPVTTNRALGQLRGKIRNELLQFRVFRFGFLQVGNVGVGVFPQREEIFVSGERPNAGCIGIRALRSSRLQGIGASHPKTR